MKGVGIELLLDLIECQEERIADLDFLRDTTRKCIEKLEVNLEREACHWSSSRVSYAAIISESHIVINSYPIERRVNVDVFTCGEVHPYHSIPLFWEAFKPKKGIINYIGESGRKVSEEN